MDSGTTVIRNINCTDPENDPRARRGDRVLWMDEHGIGCRGETTSLAPALSSLEAALEELGFRMDLRLQRSALRTRLTERADGMLACYDGGDAQYQPHID